MKTLATIMALPILGALGAFAQTAPPSLTPVSQPSGFTCTGISFLDKNSGLAIGKFNPLNMEARAVLKTTDGGATWNEVYSIPWGGSTSSGPPAFRSVAFVSASLAFVVGDGGGGFDYAPRPILVKTTNGGTSWTRVNYAEAIGPLLSAWFSDASTGYIRHAGGIYKTSDGGASLVPVPGLHGSPSAFTFLNASSGYFAGFGLIARTTNGGASWDTTFIGSNQTIHALHFPAAGTGYAAGDSGTLLKTTNGGTSWTLLSSGTPLHLKSISFVGPDTGYVAGQGGIFLKTSNGGASWTPEVNGRNLEINGLSFPDGGGYACDEAILKYTGNVAGPIAIQAPYTGVSRGPVRLIQDNRLSFTLASPAPVRIRILDIRGREIFRHSENLGAGTHVLSLPPAAGETGLRVLDFQAGAIRDALLIPAR